MASARQQAIFRRRRQALLVASCLLMGALGSATGMLGRKFAFALDPLFQKAADPMASQYLLIAGLDRDATVAKRPAQKLRTDTLLLASVQPSNHLIHLISIPRDTQVLLQGYGTERIGVARGQGGLERTRIAVEALLDIKIDHTLELDMAGAAETINRLGGVDLYVERPMRYQDKAAKLFIDLKQGLQHLDGGAALRYARFRSDELGEVGRIQRQQHLLHALEAKAVAPLNVWRLPQLASDLRHALKTDLSLNELSSLARFLKSRPAVSFSTLPGDLGHDAYWIPHHGRIAKLIESLKADVPTLKKRLDAPMVEILFAPSMDQKATKLAAKLGERGLVVVRTAPAATGTRLISRVIGRNGNPILHPALAAEAPGLGWELSDDVSQYSADYTVVVGADYR